MVYHQRALDCTFGALADPTRREILARLATGEKAIGELAGRFDMTLPAVSKHVRVLQRAGLAVVRRDGRVRRATFRSAPLRDAAEWIERYRHFWEFQFDQLSAYLANPSQESSVWGSTSPAPNASSKSAGRLRRRDNASSRPGPVQKKSASGRRRGR